MPRGQLVFPFLIDLALLDTDAVAVDPDGVGPLTSGYDDVFREPIVLPPVESSAITDALRYETLISLHGQVEPEREEALQMMLTGRSPQSRIGIVFHFEELEEVGMVETSTGRPLIRAPGARLLAFRNVETGALIEEVAAKPGLYAVQVQSIGWGLGPFRNLLLVTFEERQLSVSSTGGM